MASTNPNYTYLNQTDLSDSQIEETVRTYLTHATEYSRLIERVPDASIRIQSHTLNPFLEQYKKHNLKLPILFVGCGSGRDIQTAEERGFACVGIDISPEMIQITKANGVTSPLHIMDMRDINFPLNSFGGIFCETAISHITKADQIKVLRHFEQILTPKGLLFLGIRLGTGKVFYSNDNIGGKRFNTTMTRQESDNLISTSGLKIVQNPEKEVLDRPKVINYILQKT